MTAGPYRDAGERVARYFCIVCYKWAATSPGICGNCSAPLHDMANPEALQMMRDEANRRLVRAAELEETSETRFAGWMVSRLLTLVDRGVAALRGKPPPASARATLAARRARDNVPVVMNNEMKPGILEAPGEDPQTLDAQGLVRWFGATLHD
jgi:hypothetical protein